MDVETKSRRLAAIGYWPTFRLETNGWRCVLFNGVQPRWSPPEGDGATMLEALDAADAERVRVEGRL